MLLLEVAMYIKDIQEEECETAIKVSFIDLPNRKGEDPSYQRGAKRPIIAILTACWGQSSV